MPLLHRLPRFVPLSVLAACLWAATGQAQETASLRARLQAALDSVVVRPSIPGATLGVALPDGSSLALAAGWADTARRVPMAADSRMLQGSVGKTYFGAVALQLVAEGRLDLDAPVSTYLGHLDWFASVPNAADVTVRQIMSHTSGIVRYETSRGFLADLRDDPLRTWTPGQRLAYLRGSEPPFAAGEGWDYSDTNYILVASIIEAVTGESAYAEIRRRLLGPLDLDDTVPSDRPRVPGLVQGYAGVGNPFGGSDEMVADGALTINPQFEWGGGGFASSAEDLARWTWAVQEGLAFDPSLFADYRAGTPAPLGPEASYGLGVIMMELPAGTAWGHSGFMPGYRTEAYYFPGGRYALALQINTSSRGAFERQPLMTLSALASVMNAWLDEQGER